MFITKMHIPRRRVLTDDQVAQLATSGGALCDHRPPRVGQPRPGETGCGTAGATDVRAPAAFLDPSSRIGTITSRQRVDLSLVRGDPTEEIADLAAIEEVFVGGVRLRHDGPSAA